MKPDAITAAKTCFAAATQTDSEVMRAYFLGAAECFIAEIREELRQLEIVRAARQREIEAGAQTQGRQLEIPRETR